MCRSVHWLDTGAENKYYMCGTGRREALAAGAAPLALRSRTLCSKGAVLIGGSNIQDSLLKAVYNFSKLRVCYEPLASLGS